MSIEEIKKDILIEANSFYDITTLKNKSVFEFNKYQLIAIIVNCAFSLELYFKYIYLCIYNELYKGKNKGNNGHNLLDIYNIIKHYGLENFIEKYFKKEEIEKILEQMSSAFVDWRYAYEGKKQLIVNYILLKDFIAYISEYANNVEKNKYER